MALPKFEKDIAYISKLDDYPNDVGGMSADELKAEFDKSGEDIQKYINDTLIPQIESDIEAAALGVGALGTISTEKLSDKAVTTSKLADSSVVTDKLADGSVNTSKLADGSVNTSKLADGSVNTSKLADDSVTRGKLANESVSTEKIFPGAVTNSKIAAGAVSLDKLAEDTRSVVLEDILVADYWWEKASPFSLYPYSAKIYTPNMGIDESYIPNITFDENNESLAEIATTFDGGFFIYAYSPPETIVKILSAEFTPGLAREFANEVFATITVIYQAGKEVTCSGDTITTKAKTTSGKWTFAIPYAGTWTISDGENSQSVNISTQGQNVSVALSQNVIILKDGVLNPAFGEWIPVSFNANIMTSFSNGQIIGTQDGTAGNCGYFSMPNSVAGFSKLKFRANVSSIVSSYSFNVALATERIVGNTSFSTKLAILDAKTTITTANSGFTEYELDISALPVGEYYLTVVAVANFAIDYIELVK